MAKNHQLSKSEIKAIVSKYADHPLRTSLEDIVNTWNMESEGFSLSTEEVFYHVVRSIDELLSIAGSRKRRVYCQKLWVNLHTHLDDQVTSNRVDLNRSLALIVGAFGECLMMIDNLKYTTEVMLLMASNQYRVETTKAFHAWRRTTEGDAVKEWLLEYCKSEECLSHEIEIIVKEMRKTQIIDYRNASGQFQPVISGNDKVIVIGDHGTNIEHVDTNYQK